MRNLSLFTYVTMVLLASRGNAQTIENKTPLTPETGEHFGWAVARCSRLGTSRDDVALGVIHADIPGTTDTGESFVWNY